MTYKRPPARILERSITAGNGPYAVTAIDNSFKRFSSFMSIGDTTHASIVEPGVGFWTGVITYSATNEITLTTVEETSGTFGVGTKEIIGGHLAARGAVPDDISGAIVTGGSSTAYTVSSIRVYDSLTRLNGNLIAFTPHTTSGAAPTLNVDSLGAKPLRAVPGADLLSGVLIQGTPYLCLYSNADQVFYLHGMFGNPYNVPLAGGMDYWGPSAPNSAFAFPIGQGLNTTTYAALFGIIGYTYGGSGSTFNLPDKTGRVSAMKEASASRLTSAAVGIDGATLGSAGGLQTAPLAVGQVPDITSQNGSVSLSASVNTVNWVASNTNDSTPQSVGNGGTGVGVTVTLSNPVVSKLQSTGNATGSVSVASQSTGGSGPSHRNVQPTIVCNYIMRVL